MKKKKINWGIVGFISLILGVFMRILLPMNGSFLGFQPTNSQLNFIIFLGSVSLIVAIFSLLEFFNHTSLTSKLVGTGLIWFGLDLATPPYPDIDAFYLLPIFLMIFNAKSLNDAVSLLPLYIVTSIVIGLSLAMIGFSLAGVKITKIFKK